jgi:uncharacterized membrane protein (UPF0136 family)
MEAQVKTRTGSVITLLIGVWVALSPIWITMTGGQITSVIITGVIIALAGLVQYFWANSLPSWISGLASAWLFISAFLFSAGTGVKWSNILSAIAVFILSFWDGVEVAQYREYQQQHHARG